MSTPRCSRCNAELLPEVNFCRQCGAAVDVASRSNSVELPTTKFQPNVEESPTRRFEVRPTSRGRSPGENPGSAVERSGGESPRRQRAPVALIVGILALVAVGVIAGTALIRRKTVSTPPAATATTSTLIYPGSRTLLDTKSEAGRAMQLQTSDTLDQVVAWYTANLKPMKTVRLTSSTVVLKNQNVTATVVAEDNKTNILIKLGP